MYRGHLLECLQSNIDKLSPKQCLPLVYKLSEWQADNIKFDHSLHMACLKDKEKLCFDIPTGNGLVYNCLSRHIGSGRMSQSVNLFINYNLIKIYFSIMCI